MSLEEEHSRQRHQKGARDSKKAGVAGTEWDGTPEESGGIVM